MNSNFYSNGKLLLTSEYLVLDGAMALAIPTVYGQILEVKPGAVNTLSWVGLDEKKQVWFEAKFETNNQLSIILTSNTQVASTLQKILISARKLNPDFISSQSGIKVSTNLNFPRDWGLGSSSTLINNIAQWAKVDAFELLEKSFGGSGYDIACAQSDFPILYSNKTKPPFVKQIKDLNWPFVDELYFVYLNKKQDSKKSILHYNNVTSDKKPYIEKIDQITHKITQTSSLEQFNNLIDLHESIISGVLQLSTIKELLFSDFRGSIKSLGGWGGDFILATGESVPEYFRKKGFKTIIPFKNMIK